jgi:hypothetical protein
MAKAKLPPANDWQARSIEDWNANTYRAYLYDQHKERLGRDYIGKPVKVEAALISRMYKEHGKQVVKNFIDACFTAYKPSGGYTGCNFWFMYSYMRERLLPQVQDAAAVEIAEKQTDLDNIEW